LSPSIDVDFVGGNVGASVVTICVDGGELTFLSGVGLGVATTADLSEGSNEGLEVVGERVGSKVGLSEVGWLVALTAFSVELIDGIKEGFLDFDL
jgi:hypothetical protein